MTPSAPDSSLPWELGQVLVHDLFLRGDVFVRCWTRLGRPGDTPHEFYWETYWDVVGGGDTVSTAAALHMDVDHRPVAYEVWSDRLPLRRVNFEGTTAVVELTDGSTQMVRGPGPASSVLASNVVGQFALLAVSLPRTEPEVHTVFFSPETLAFHPLAIQRTASSPEQTTWSTDLGVDLICDWRGRLVRMDIPGQQAKAIGAVGDFPTVDREALRRPKLRYTPPETLAVEVRDVILWMAPAGPGALAGRSGCPAGGGRGSRGAPGCGATPSTQ